MKIKAALVVLFVFVYGAEAFGAGVDENLRASYYYGPPPYEYGYSGEQDRYPEYLPREFGRKTEESAAQQEPEQPQEEPQPDFVPYDEAKERYSGEESEAPAVPPDYLEIADADGFIPYEYAREKYSDH